MKFDVFMKKLLFVFLLVIVAFGFARFAVADSVSDIIFPIPELGGCTDQNACKTYCDDPGHLDACVQFGEKHGLVKAEEVRKAQEFKEIAGPGGCKGSTECRTYCEDTAHQSECLDFGEKNGFIGKAEAEQARKIAGKSGPGGCQGEACKTYCNDSAHQEECLSFAEENGFIKKDEAAQIRKLGFAGGPGGCKGQDACRQYCENLAHQSECVDFAEKNNLMSPEEVAQARKIAGKPGPGGCQGEACKTFCENSDNAQACLEFAQKEGLIAPEEAVRAQKFVQATQNGGPGGCRGQQCKDYCNDPAHQGECFDFAKKQGLIGPEDEQQFEAGKKIQEVVKASGGPGGCTGQDACRSYCSDAAHGEECIAFGATHGGIPPEQAKQMLKEFTEKRFMGTGEFQPPQDLQKFEQDSNRRFDQFRLLEQQFRGSPDAQGFGPPQGFNSPENNGSQERANRERSMTPNKFVGPGGCASPSECIQYCTEHAEECFNSGSAKTSGGHFPEGDATPGETPPQIRSNLFRPATPKSVHPLEDNKYSEDFHPPEGKNDFNQSRPPEEFQKQYEQKYQQEYQQRSPQGVNPIPGTSGIPNTSAPSMMPENGHFPDSYSPPPTGFTQPPTGEVAPQYTSPPEGTLQPPPQNFSPPPSEQSAPPPSSAPPPPSSGRVPSTSFFVTFLKTIGNY